jgi:hypothetical protein
MFKRNAALIIVAGLVVGGGAVAWARSDGGRPTLAAATSTAATVNPGAANPGAAGRTRARGLLARVVHGNLIVRGAGGKFQNVVYDRGKEKSLAGDKLTVTRPDGVDVTVTLTSSTKYRGVTGSSQLQVGHATLVLSMPDGSALIVAQPNPQRAGTRAGAGASANANATTGAAVDGTDVLSGLGGFSA